MGAKAAAPDRPGARNRENRTTIAREAPTRTELASKQIEQLFLACVSHELRTPLNAIIGFTEILLMEIPGALNDIQKEQIEIVQASGKHLLGMIDDLLYLARIESGKAQFEVDEVVCQKVLEEVARTLQPLAAERGLTVAVIAPKRPLRIRTSIRALRQVLLNLTSNAIKFTESGGIRLAVTSGTAGARRVARFTVADTGVGIPPDQRERLFEAFEQLETDTSMRREGTGLGLYISRKLATLLGGEIRCESEPGTGTTFALEIDKDGG